MRALTDMGKRMLLGGCAVMVAIALAVPLFQQTLGEDVPGYERPRLPACAGWDDAAGEAIADLVSARRDVDRHLVGDAAFRLRRARRNCHAGWTRLACLDYQAIIRGSPRLTRGFLPANLACPLPDHESIGNVAQHFAPVETASASRP